MSDVIRGNLYDYPQYYDLLFGADWKEEIAFLQQCFDRHAQRRVARVFEPACGTGRLLIKLAQAGYSVAGNDLNEQAVTYCNARLVRHGYPPSAAAGDMSNFRVSRKFDAGFNLINSFRHLSTDAQAHSHLKCMSQAIHKGGLYLLGLHLIPARGSRIETETWTARRGRVQIRSRMWSKGIDRRQRMERLGMRFDVQTPRRRLRIDDEMFYRTYSARQMADLLDRVPAWDLIATYDFMCDVNDPITVTPTTEDVIYVLRKR